MSAGSHLRDGRRSLAEFKQELFKDEDGPGGAEDDEGLPAEEAEHGTGQSCAQETLHHTLSEEKTQKHVEEEDESGAGGKLKHSRHDDQTSDETRGREGWTYDNDGVCRESEGRVNSSL